MTPPFRVSPGPLAGPFEQMCARLADLRFADALWNRRLDVWTSDSGTQEKIRHRLGWLDAMDAVTRRLGDLRTLAESVRAEAPSSVVLLGMGGSSLAPEVLRQVLGVQRGYPEFRMLDSVDPEAVDSALSDASTSLFILASKSGTTIEPNVMAAEARRRLIAAGQPRWGSRFIAITDANTALHQRAQDEEFRETFVNPADIGGRYSALSLFGMVPAALMGVDVEQVFERARQMETACRTADPQVNPGLALGAFMAAGTRNGRDKLTLVLPARLAAFGLWVEQLVAESTGKHGRGVVPIAGESRIERFGDDRVVVAVSLRGSESPASLDAIRTSGAPLFELNIGDVAEIGAEFLRWEVATATAGLLLEINPFDEPNVQQAKDATRALLAAYRSNGRLPVRKRHGEIAGAHLTLSAAAESQLPDARYFLRLLGAGDYLALLAYLPPDNVPFAVALQDIRTSIGSASRCATMFGYGPRYLHSTGQLHKGGANNGVFVIVTAAASQDLPIPDEPFSFGVLEMAQALGDFTSLDDADRRALHIHLPSRDVDLLRGVFSQLLESA